MGNEGGSSSNLPLASIPPPMSALEHEVWQKFIQERCGLYFSETRLRFLRQRLWERMRARGLKTYGEFYHYVAFNAAGNDEWAEILELLLNHETGFFRHMPSFDALLNNVLPDLMQEKRRHGVNQITMWSAGCSTGQEAYSMAMTFAELLGWSRGRAWPAPASTTRTPVPLPPLDEAGVTHPAGGVHPAAFGGGWQVKVSGTDINPRAVERGRRGVYKASEVRYMPDQYRELYMTTQPDEKGGPPWYHIVPSIKALVQFGHLNLNDDQAYWISAQDVIFCQNVLLYFEPQSRIEIVRRLCARLNPGGYLFLAPAEVVGLKLPNVQLVRQRDSLIYQRKL